MALREFSRNSDSFRAAQKVSARGRKCPHPFKGNPMSNSAATGDDRDESLFQRMVRESAERAEPADEREALFERLRDQATIEREIREADEREGVFKNKDTPTEKPADIGEAEAEPVAAEPAAPPAVVIYAAPSSASISVRLASPFTVDGVAVKRFDFLSPSVGDVEAVMAGDISENEMHARMAGVPAAAIQAMRWDDAERVLSVARILAPEIRRA